MRTIAAISIVVLATLPLFAQDAGSRAKLTQREDVFEFTEKPAVTRKGNDFIIQFAVKGNCDVAIAVEDEEGKVRRHVAAGVLGTNAPKPFQKNSLKQTIVWDGKDDQGKYLDDTDELTLRVSLGLKPRFEKTLYWSPRKRTRSIKYLRASQLLAATPEGVLAYDGGNGQHIRLFNHEGDYLRTVYPPPSNKVREVNGIELMKYPQDGKELPLKEAKLPQNTFLTSGDAKVWAVSGTRIALLGRSLNRLSMDGSSGGMPLAGTAKVDLKINAAGTRNNSGGPTSVPPSSIALSPDGKWLYMTGYWKQFGVFGWHGSLHCVMRTRFDEDGPVELFKGSTDQKKPGSGNDQLHAPLGVACDAKGRVYVADYMNDRVQVFDAAGKYLKSIKTPKPIRVQIGRNDEIWVFSWCMKTAPNVKATLTRFGPFENLTRLGHWGVPARANKESASSGVNATVDSWSDPVRVWISNGKKWRGGDPLEETGIEIFEIKGKKLKAVRQFIKEAKKEVGFIRPPRHMKQRLYFDQKNNKLYVGEIHDPWSFHCTSMANVARISPDSGKVKTTALPFDAEDMVFDMNGHAVLRTQTKMARFDAKIWREVPFDYGEEMTMTTWNVRRCGVISALVAAGQGVDGTFQAGGMGVSPKGHVFMTICNSKGKASRKGTKNVHLTGKVRKYTPQLYPGRARPWEVHVWDRHGEVLYEDAVPGIGRMGSIAMDRDDNIYVMVAGLGLVNGKPYHNPISCTVFKMRPQTKIVGTKGVLPLPAEARPKRKPDIIKAECAGDLWIEKVDWVRGGVGLNGKRKGCLCASQSHFRLDYYARLFLPEVDRYSVLVVDTNGNQVVRMGQYGNVDDGMPLEKKGGPPTPRSIGGDEIALMHGQWLAVHSDRRLFIGDMGNARIACVKLGYHTDAKIKLEDVVE